MIMLDMVRTFHGDEAGTTAIEYGLIAVLVCVGMIAGAQSVGLSLKALWGGVATDFGNAAGTPSG